MFTGAAVQVVVVVVVVDADDVEVEVAVASVIVVCVVLFDESLLAQVLVTVSIVFNFGGEFCTFELLNLLDDRLIDDEFRRDLW